MSTGVNHVMLLGHLGADPESRSTPGGKRVTEFRMATSHRWVDRDGMRQEETQWHRVETWGRTAELCSEFLSRGSQVFLEGRLRTDRWQDREGRDRFTTKIIASRVVFLGKGRGQQDRGQQDGLGGQSTRGGEPMGRERLFESHGLMSGEGGWNEAPRGSAAED